MDVQKNETFKDTQLIYVGGIHDSYSDVLQIVFQLKEILPNNFILSTFDCTHAKNPKDQIDIVNQI